MQIFRSLAGYSLGRADIVRRAMAKKKKKVMDEEKEVFIHGLEDENGNIIVDGCIRRGIDEKTALDIFSEMESFASYAFNRAHAAAYAYISYQTAYVKYHYPCEYLAALLTSVLGDSGKIASYIDECTRNKINVLPPHVNNSEAGFTVNGRDIRFGLGAVKSLGYGLIEAIVRERERKGKFTSFYDFCSRVYGRELNKRALENLIKCGALDGIGANRRQMLLAAGPFCDRIAEEKKSRIEGQMNFFGDDDGLVGGSPELPKVAEFSHQELLEMEMETAGIYFSGHPMAEYDDVIRALGSDRIGELSSEESYPDGKRVDIIAFISKIKLKTTKNNSRMAFVQVEDRYGSVELIVFPRVLDEYGGLLQQGNAVRIGGTVSRREDAAVQIICDRVFIAPKKVTDPAPTVKKGKNTPPGLYLRVSNESCEQYRRAMQIIDIFDGSVPLYIYFTENKKLWRAPRFRFVDPNSVMLRELKKRIGTENVNLVT